MYANSKSAKMYPARHPHKCFHCSYEQNHKGIGQLKDIVQPIQPNEPGQNPVKEEIQASAQVGTEDKHPKKSFLRKYFPCFFRNKSKKMDKKEMKVATSAQLAAIESAESSPPESIVKEKKMAPDVEPKLTLSPVIETTKDEMTKTDPESVRIEPATPIPRQWLRKKRSFQLLRWKKRRSHQLN